MRGKSIDELVARALSDDARRRAILDDLDAALRAAGVKPRPQLVAHLRARLGAGAQ